MMVPIPGEFPQKGRWRHARLILAASLAAASLIIGILVVAPLLFFTRQSKGNGPSSGTHPINITLSPCASLPRPALVGLCTQQQLKDLLQQRKMGAYVLVLERGYLDMNQLVLSYHVFSQSSGQETLAQLDAVITTSQGQSFRPYASAWVSGGPQVDQFSTPPLPAQTQTLQLHVEVKAFRALPPAGPSTSPPQAVVPGPVTFDFALEYHHGLVVTPHQTVTQQALSVMLEQVRISPSETILEGTTQGTGPSSPNDYTFSLNAAGRSPDFPASSNFGFGGESTPFSVVYDEGLFRQQGTWTFEIAIGGLGRSWMFHFMVP